MKRLLTFSLLSIGLTAAAQTQITNGGFETWTGSGVNIEPTDFNSNKSGVGLASLGGQTCFQDQSIFHGGSSSVRVETISGPFGVVVNGNVTSGIVHAPSTNKLEGYLGTVNSGDASDVRRIAFTGRPDSVTGWYQYVAGNAAEKGKVRVILHTGQYNDPETPYNGNHPDLSANKIGDALFNSAAGVNVSTWKRFSVPFSYVSVATPSFVMINVTSSDNQNTTVAGSKMWLDDIQFIYVPVPAVNAPATFCAGAATTFSGQATNSPTGWSWSFPGGTPGSSTAQNPTVTYASAGTYTATLIASNSTATSTPVTYTFVVNAVPSVSSSSATICAGQSATLTAGGATTYSWSTSATTASISVSPSATTAYTVTGTSNGCSKTVTTSVVVDVPAVNTSSATICAGGTATLVASGANTYTWSTGATGASFTVSPGANTNYTVTGTSALGCMATAVAQVSITTSPTISVNSETICAGSSATLTANGVSTYTWSNSSNNQSIQVNPTTTTVYTVTGMASGCSATVSETATVTVNALPVVSMNPLGNLCVSDPAVTLVGSPSGGSFSGTGVSGNTFNPAVAGAGTFTVVYSYTNTSGCSATSNATVTVNLCTGIEELGSHAVSLFPNPVSDLLNVTLNTGAHAYKAEVYDMSGKLVYAGTGSGAGFSIATSQLGKGLYVLKVTIDGSKQAVARFIRE